MKSAAYFGGKQAGCIGLLTLLSQGYEVRCVVAYGQMVSNLASALGFLVYDTIKHPDIPALLEGADLLLSVHCREFVPLALLKIPRLGGLNVHPCLSKYKGASPIQHFMDDSGKVASVGVHRMTEILDEGEILSELYLDVNGCATAEEVYNELYPIYAQAIIAAIQKLEKMDD